MTTIEILVSGLTASMGIIGYFLRIVHNDVRKNTEENGRLKGKIELVEQENRLKYTAIQEQTQLEIKMLTRSVNDLTKTVKELVLRG